MGKIKNKQLQFGPTSICDVILMLKLRHHVSAYSGFPGSLVFPIQNELFSGEQLKESIIPVSMG